MFGAGRELRSMEAATGTFLRGARRGLVIGARLPALEQAHVVSRLAETVGLQGGFDALLWRVDRDLRAGLVALRDKLSPGARVFLVAELVPSMWGVTKELLGGREVVRLTREGICEDVLLGGFENPRVWIDTARLLAVSANVPSMPDELDRAFTQPPRG